ncbi:hypothetical protein ACLB2K_070073 [Fragaria x ananassa]
MLMEDVQKGLPSSGSNSSGLSTDKWLVVEKRVEEILWTVQPNVTSEWRRREIIDYIQRVIKGCFGTEVLSFGSTPLKTYIPDGDIDLTVICHRNREDELAGDVCGLLEGAPKEMAFLVEDVRCVYAKVKIIKCTVNNIPVDISFNQVAGLCTLCFLEQVDQFIGRDHLFKKSIILIKAWCYYESRTLGAQHGLISTYALETLVLCIINLFHSSLHGPLQVFHRFLEYYGNFDWQNYCISINGPVSLSSVDKIREILENEGENFLLPKEFVRKCIDAVSDPRKINVARMQDFPIKHLNVVDPLKDNNNLGRSVTSGNFKRIKSAFALGEKQLRKILALPGESIGAELQKEFFMSTIDRNGRGQRPDLHTPVPAFGSGRSIPSNLTGDYDYYYGGILSAYALHDQSLHLSSQPYLPPSQVQNNTAWNARTWSLEQLNWDVFDRMSVNAYALPFYHCASQQTANMRTMRGTGTYIPDRSPHYRPVHSKMRGRPEYRTRRVTMKPAQKGNQDEVTSGTNTGVLESSSDLSLEEFPQLPGTELPTPSQVNQSGKTWTDLQPQVPPHTNEDRSLGVLGHVPLPLGMHPHETRADSCSSDTLDFRPGVPVMGMPSQQACSSTDEINKEKFQLDDKDFPPLSSSDEVKKEKS